MTTRIIKKCKLLIWSLKFFFKSIYKIDFFRVKPDGFYEDEDHYDLASAPNTDCEATYPECEETILSKVISSIITNKTNVSRYGLSFYSIIYFSTQFFIMIRICYLSLS